MSRSIARIAFFLLLAAGSIVLSVLAKPWLYGLHGGVAGGFGALTVMYGSKWFNRLWPKPMKGWAE
ncbi:MAG: hypothetical protein J7500_10910 [Sphingomonas sp.]|uniref:hypothetical protein n=1 Tax=Sphingomonas sp. TaxID=28214 RepID=UPI001B022997|nr:hypothetical protein [Sphingomonas sp.]MBO9623210.1 hypothetical protein [Sphingomonas sp.]